jgi:netrin-G3 ligand
LFNRLDVVPKLLNLKHLDLRNCNLQFLYSDDMRMIPNVEYLFLSHNKIKTIQSNTFTNQRCLKHLDLSYNNWFILSNKTKQFFKPAELTIFSDAFTSLPLETLDMSFSLLNIRNATRSGIPSLFGPNLKHLSLCYTMVSRLRMDMFENANSLKILDISGNFGVAQSLNRDVFRHLNNSLEVLYVKHNNIRSLIWTSQLSKLRFINLKNNLLSSIDDRSFQLMPNLEIIDMSSNLIINWMMPIFEQNPLLKILNIRNNYINSFTNDMLRDFSRVDYLTMGGNPFECTCVLKEVFHTVLPSEEDGFELDVDNELSQFFMEDKNQTTNERQGSKSVATFLYETYFSKELVRTDEKVRIKRANKVRVFLK